MATVTINVTQEHINKGKRDHCNRCPIALAAIDAGFRAVAVDGYSITYGKTLKALKQYNSGVVHEEAGMPKRASRFVEKFDEGKPVRPFSFKLKTPAERLHEFKFTGTYTGKH